MEYIPRFFEELWPENEFYFIVPHNHPEVFLSWYTWAALIYLTAAFFSGLDTRKILLFIISSAIIIYFSPPYYVIYLVFIYILYRLLFAEINYRLRLVLFITYLLIYGSASLFMIFVLKEIGWVTLAISVFVNSLGKKAIYLFYETTSGKLPRMTLMDFIFYLVFLPLAYPALPLSPSEFMKGFEPRKKYPLHKTFLRGAASTSWGVCKIMIFLTFREELFPILNFDVMYENMDSLHVGTIWIVIFVNYILWYFYFSGLYNVSLGISNMCGFRISPNFINPLLARDPLDLWKRWNIHYRAWLLRIFYFPLWWKYKITILNVLLVFIISGLSHTFISLFRGYFYWGYFLYFVIQGIGVIIIMIVKKGAMVSGDVEREGGLRLKTILSIAATFVYTSLVHVVLFANFKALSLYDTTQIYAKLFGLR